MEILGIDVGGSGIKGAPVDLRTGKLSAERLRVRTPGKARPKDVGAVVADIVHHFGWKGPVGCAFPAQIKGGVARTAANIDEAWIGTNAAKLFEQKAGCPFLVVNDADAAATAEMIYGAGRGQTGVVMLLTFGTGIGSALFVNQTLVPNTEFGHFYLHEMAAEHYAADRIRKEEDLSWEEWAGRVQEYLSHLERLFDIDLFILGGGISKPRKTEKFIHLLKTNAELVPARLRNDAGIIGAACIARALVDED